MNNNTNKKDIIQKIIDFKNERDLENCILYLEKQIQKIITNNEIHSEEEKYFLSQLKNELGLCYFYAEQYAKSKQSYIDAISYCNTNINANYNLADFYFQTKEFEKCIQLLENTIKQDNKHIPSIYLIGLCYSCMGKPEQALPYFIQTTNLDTNSIGGNYWAGECYLYQKEFAKALPYFQKSYALNPDHLDSARGLAISYLETGNAQQALEICDAIIAKNSIESISMYQIKGEALIQLQDFKQAAKLHVQLAVLELDARDYVVHQANIILEKYNKQNALEYIEIILEKIPDLKLSFDKILNKNAIPKFSSIIKK